MELIHKLHFKEGDICPWWFAYFFDNRLRRLFHSPEKLLKNYVKEGMTTIDIGCGMGYFSLGMARLVKESGAVIAVDVQQEMINITEKRAEKEGLFDRIAPHLCQPEKIGIHHPVDFALVFWVAHEVPDEKSLFEQLFTILKPSGNLLLVEPKIHVSRSRYDSIIQAAESAGFKQNEQPKISFSRACIFKK